MTTAMQTTLLPGMYTAAKIPFADYCAIDAVNASTLKCAVRSLAHYHHARNAPREQTDAHRVGEALHYAILQPELFADQCVRSPKFNRRSNAGKEECAAFESANVGKVILDTEEWDQVQAMARSAEASPDVRELMAESAQHETTCLWTDDDTGMLCKARFDRLSFGGKSIVDVKSARDASPDGFARAIAQYQYHFSARFYLRGAMARTGEHFKFSWVAIEKEPPYAVAVYKPSPTMLEVADRQIDVALRRVREAKETGNYPAFDSGIKNVELPAWSSFGWDEDA